jgi:SAM-dependent methyltransferase
MTAESIDRQTHWQKVYRTRTADSVSWYRPHLDVSIELLERAGLSADSRVIDIGGGASTLVDDLLDRGVRDVSVLDVSDEALAMARKRLGDRAKEVNWYVADVLYAVLPAGGFDFWHDRAVFHFLTDPTEAARYAQCAAEAVRIGGHAVIGGFAPDGPERCSGLPVARRSAEDIAGIFASRFSLLRKREERHRTPAGTEQSFVYTLMLRS